MDDSFQKFRLKQFKLALVKFFITENPEIFSGLLGEINEYCRSLDWKRFTDVYRP